MQLQVLPVLNDLNCSFRSKCILCPVRFAKEPIDHHDFTNEAYTSGGLCLEMNDDGELVQKVNGAIGGLALTLDALTNHYLPETVSLNE